MDDQRKHYAIELMEAALGAGTEEFPTLPNRRHPSLHIARALLPYCLQPLESGDYLPVNRHYKPLGLVSGDGMNYLADYESPKYAALVLKADSIDLTCLGLSRYGPYYLFHDGNSPLSFWGSKPAERSLYFLKLWLVFRKLGFPHPVTQYSHAVASAKTLGVDVRELMGWPA